MEKIKQYKYLIILAIVLAISFYWFQLRPAQIRKTCFRIVDAQEDKRLSAFDSKYGITQFDEVRYKKCLLEHGLEE